MVWCAQELDTPRRPHAPCSQISHALHTSYNIVWTTIAQLQDRFTVFVRILWPLHRHFCNTTFRWPCSDYFFGHLARTQMDSTSLAFCRTWKLSSRMMALRSASRSRQQMERYCCCLPAWCSVVSVPARSVAGLLVVHAMPILWHCCRHWCRLYCHMFVHRVFMYDIDQLCLPCTGLSTSCSPEN